MKWMNLPDEFCEGKFVILPVAYEKDVTYGKRAVNGALEIVRASEHLEYYDAELDCEAFLQGIKVVESVGGDSPEEMIGSVSKVVRNVGEGRFVIGVGGDHAVTLGLVDGLEGDFSVIQFDAHADFRDSWKGSSLNHACVAKQLSKKHDVGLIGVRSMDVDERKEIDGRADVHVVYGWNFSLEKVKEMLGKLKKNVYVTIDVDVFDPMFIRNTGTPEPGGLLWQDVVDCLKLIFEEKNVVGADVVEFAPKVNYEAEAFALAKLVYMICGLKSKSL